MIAARAMVARIWARLLERLPSIAQTLEEPSNWARFAAMLGVFGLHMRDSVIVGLAGLFWCVSIFVLPETGAPPPPPAQ